jgi:hypothetical protein
MPPFSRSLKSVDEIATERGWSSKRVRKLISDGLPVVEIGRQSLISDQTLDNYLRNLEAPRVAQ